MSTSHSPIFVPPSIQPLRLQDAAQLLEQEYLPLEAGYGVTADGMYHIAGSTYMRNCTGQMVDWWFGHIQTTEQYKLWHPRDHVFSDWEGPRDNDSTYIGGHHLVHEYIGGELAKLKISFRDPAEYFGEGWRAAFDKSDYSTAICGKVGLWNPENDSVRYMGHLIHLIKNEPDGCRMRSRFWLGDADGLDTPEQRMASVPNGLPQGLCKHATEEMAILGTILPELYSRLSHA
ncbi:hypothetical protein LTR08_005440 [Meristemomyces frigidus]|nr:hypothetical protein LTR08_005440 [Meristemomyces frigidus]